jgi:hypothetical protein
VRGLGGGPAGEMGIRRFLHNREVTVAQMLSPALARTRARVAGRHVLAIQDTSGLRVDDKGVGPSFHPVLAVDASLRIVPSLVDNYFLMRQGWEKAMRKQRDFADKDSRRWPSGAKSASALAQAGVACVTVIEDRQGDIYKCFAFRPADVQ